MIGSLPETNSFDLKAESLNFTFFFNEKVNTEIAQATLKGEDSEIELIVEKNGWSETLNITLPENFTPENGKYTLTTSNTINESDVLSRDNASIFFIIGEEISNGPEIVFNPDIQYECDYENGSIPYGWKRVMGSDIAESGTKGMGGSRVMFFEDGGDFNAGFYICPRGSGSPCQIFYGSYDEIKGKNDELTDYSLSLKKNSYTVSFYTAYWNNGAADNKRKINFIITDKAGNEIFSNKNISSTKNLGESAMQIVTNSDYHEFTFELAEDTKIEMEWSVSAELGWEGMIMGGVKLIANAPLSYICKQNLSEAVGSAQNTFDSAEDNKYHGIVRDNMHSVLEKYKDFAGTTENEYKSAVEEIVAAENELKNHIASVNESEDIDAEIGRAHV